MVLEAVALAATVQEEGLLALLWGWISGPLSRRLSLTVVQVGWSAAMSELACHLGWTVDVPGGFSGRVDDAQPLLDESRRSSARAWLVVTSRPSGSAACRTHPQAVDASAFAAADHVADRGDGLQRPAGPPLDSEDADTRRGSNGVVDAFDLRPAPSVADGQFGVGPRRSP